MISKNWFYCCIFFVDLSYHFNFDNILHSFEVIILKPKPWITCSLGVDHLYTRNKHQLTLDLHQQVHKLKSQRLLDPVIFFVMLFFSRNRHLKVKLAEKKTLWFGEGVRGFKIQICSAFSRKIKEKKIVMPILKES